jgi:hypothetical protein
VQRRAFIDRPADGDYFAADPAPFWRGQQRQQPGQRPQRLYAEAAGPAMTGDEVVHGQPVE